MPLKSLGIASFLGLLILGLGSAFGSSSGAGPVDGPSAKQTQSWRITSFLDDANLQGRGIFFVDFEENGTAWIAASDGLYRYDGYHWDRYTSAHGLPSDYVRSVLVTRDGKLWVGTDRGAGTFDGTTFDPAGTQDHLAGPSVRRIVEDPDGALWFCCDQWPPANVEAGLTRYRPEALDEVLFGRNIVGGNAGVHGEICALLSPIGGAGS